MKNQKTEDNIVFGYVDENGKKMGEIVGSSKYNISSTNGISFERATRTQHNQKWSQIKSNEIGMTMVSLNDSSVIKTCMDIYNNVGLVKNVIDLMSDFTVEGIDLVHPNKSVKRFWKKWFKMVRVQNRAERIINTVLKAGTCAIRRKEARLTSKQVSDMKKAEAATKRVVPIGYNILNPKKYHITKVDDLGNPIIYYNDNILANGQKLNDDEKVFICTYKKDDWDPYAKPFHYAALQDLALENKMRRMDDAVMDGAINAVRIWKLGGETKNGKPIWPTKANIEKLAQILNADTGGGMLDIIWDQYLTLETEYPPVEKILGSQKYEYVHKKILEAFGIAQVLVDGTGQGSYSNQYLSVRSLVEKIEYLRGIIIEWLEGEIKFVAKNMNFRKLPDISFQHINLGDESARLKLVMSLYDRNIISKELMLGYMDHSWDIEKERISQELTEEESNEKLVSYGPFKQMNEDVAGENDGGDGRPSSEPSTKQEKERDTKPQGASEEIFDYINAAYGIQSEIDNVFNDIYLGKNGVKNVKQLTKDKKEELDSMKFEIFCNFEQGSVINKENILKICKSKDSVAAKKTKEKYKKAYKEQLAKKETLGLEDIRHIRAVAWALSRI